MSRAPTSNDAPCRERYTTVLADGELVTINGKPITEELPEEKGDGRLSYVKACQCGAWHLRIWPKDNPAQVMNVPFHCRSWRCEGDCRLWKGSQDFARIKVAMESRKHWCHVTLTFEQPEGSDPVAMFKKGVKLWAKLRKRLARRFGDMAYIQTWEVHRSGFPHVHLAVANEELFRSANDEPRENWERELMLAATECGFGRIGWLEQLRSKAAMAGYLTKLARELTGSGKDYQVPVNAPPHFRRLRASQGLLPPPIKDESLTGDLVMRPCAPRNSSLLVNTGISGRASAKKVSEK